jgi:hypothetical protein
MQKSSYRYFLRALLLAILFFAYLLIARPYQMNWGAEEEEIERDMPGDELAPSPTFSATRAITIKGQPREIWPWLIQMGYNRAGFYGYDILENLGSSRGIRSADTIIPTFQNFEVGDSVPISAIVDLTFYAIDSPNYLIWTGEYQEGSFTWAIYPQDDNECRLVSRIRWSHHWWKPHLLFLDLFTEFTDFLAVKEVLTGIKNRVEGKTESFLWQSIEFFAYLLAFLLFFIIFLWMLFLPLRWDRWFLALIAGLIWMASWYSPLPVWLGIIALIILIFMWKKDILKHILK